MSRLLLTQLTYKFRNSLARRRGVTILRVMDIHRHKDSLSFSRDKNSEDFKSNWAIGKIKHQIQMPKD